MAFNCSQYRYNITSQIQAQTVQHLYLAHRHQHFNARVAAPTRPCLLEITDQSVTCRHSLFLLSQSREARSLLPLFPAHLAHLGRDSIHFKSVTKIITKNITKNVTKNLSKSYNKKFKKSVVDTYLLFKLDFRDDFRDNFRDIFKCIELHPRSLV